ncbi:unnamed protein product [Cladocopium goreaui]|uniref:Pentatricopeptide repeat-containing protein, chloroplastic n=1 Tax=Cladocopium goreaui TaxID=2562237 RepID=A0A9P1CBV2_9DINO|nr:unnamed protein product [Cladocopium goreaui]
MFRLGNPVISTETLLDTPAVRKPHASAELGGRKGRKSRKQKKFWLLQQLRSAETLKHLQIAQIAQIAHSLAELQQSCLLTSTQDYAHAIRALGVVGWWRDALAVLRSQTEGQNGLKSKEDTPMYNAAIVALDAAPLRWERSLALWTQCFPDISTANSVATALKGALQWEHAFTMLKRSEDQGIKMDTVSQNILITASAAIGCTWRRILSRMAKFEQDIISVNSGLSTLGSKSCWGECLVLLEDSPSRRVVLDQMAASCGIIATQDLGHWPTTFTLLFNKRTTHEPEVDPVIPVFASASEILRADSISENNWIRDMNQRQLFESLQLWPAGLAILEMGGGNSVDALGKRATGHNFRVATANQCRIFLHLLHSQPFLRIGPVSFGIQKVRRCYKQQWALLRVPAVGRLELRAWQPALRRSRPKVSLFHDTWKVVLLLSSNCIKPRSTAPSSCFSSKALVGAADAVGEIIRNVLDGGEWPLALSALQSLGLAKLEADAFTWTSAISACEKFGPKSEHGAMELQEILRQRKVTQSKVADTLANILPQWKARPKKATAFLSTLARQKHSELARLVQSVLLVMRDSFIQVNVYHYGAAMAAYERLGNWEGALDLLSSIHELLGKKIKAVFFCWGCLCVCV